MSDGAAELTGYSDAPIEITSVHHVGSTVFLAGGEIEAHVRQVTISESGVMYEVVWWHERDRKSEWVSEFEVSAGESSKQQCIGFRSDCNGS